MVRMNRLRPYILQPACEPSPYTYCQNRSAPFGINRQKYHKFGSHSLIFYHPFSPPENRADRGGPSGKTVGFSPERTKKGHGIAPMTSPPTFIPKKLPCKGSHYQIGGQIRCADGLCGIVYDQKSFVISSQLIERNR